MIDSLSRLLPAFWILFLLSAAWHWGKHDTDGHWKTVYRHTCGHISIYRTDVCPKCGGQGGWVTFIGRWRWVAPFTGYWQEKEVQK